jgi:[ribosomal protein S5]-alanine N-acetyltransferase
MSTFRARHRDTPGVHELERLTGDHLQAVLAFELENRSYFARSINDRGDEFYESLREHHDGLLAEQDAGICAFYVLGERDGSIVGRFNLYDLEDGSARVGYRVAERVAGRGVASATLRELCRKAAGDHGLRTLTAEAGRANVASRRVLEKTGFIVTGNCVVAGEPGLKFTLALADEPS